MCYLAGMAILWVHSMALIDGVLEMVGPLRSGGKDDVDWVRLYKLYDRDRWA